MPARLIRDELLDSERVQTLPVEARWLYVSILLSADDIGIFQAAAFRLSRRAGIDFSVTASLLQLLVDNDLVRLYQVDSKEFGFVPRFRQRMQLRKLKHPLPPAALMQDDKDAVNKINDLGSKSTVNPGESPKVSVNYGKSPSEAEAEAEEKKEISTPAVSQSTKPPAPVDSIIQAYHDALPSLPRVKIKSVSRQRAAKTFWGWVMTSTKSDGSRRATNAEEALLWIAGYFARAGQNDFLMGKTRRSEQHQGWTCDFDFLLTERGMKHVIERTLEAA